MHLLFFSALILLNVGPARIAVAADKSQHPCLYKPEGLGLPPFPISFSPCWHDNLPAANFWPDGKDFLSHVTDADHHGRMRPAMLNALPEALLRAKQRTSQNPQYLVHSCYYYKNAYNPTLNRWIHNFLIPLCVDGNSLPEVFCTAWNEGYCEKRTVLTIAQVQDLLRVSCNEAHAKFNDIMTLSWAEFCKKYPCKRSFYLPTTSDEDPLKEEPVVSKNRAALIKLNDYLNNGAPLDGYEYDDLASPIRRLNDAESGLRTGATKTANITKAEATELIALYNSLYNEDGTGSPIILHSDDEEVFEE